MAAENQKVIWLILLLSFQFSSGKPSKEDLDGAEANGKLEIIKQIKKVNDDGSYTIGYEADDGSFKIESRDVLGNIKGTYGYIDEDGEIKRVSYSTNNSSEILTKPEAPSVVQRIPKINKTTSSTRRSGVVYNGATTPSTPTTTTVIQSIPRRRATTTSTQATTTTTTTTDSAYSDFIKAAVQASKSLTTKSTLIYDGAHSTPARILLQSRPISRTSSEQDDPQKSEGQLVRPDVAARPTEIPIYHRPLSLKDTLLDSDAKPVSEEPEAPGNILRRQLIPNKTGYDPRQHLLNLQQSSGGADVVDVYSASLTTGTPRPLFTTSRPRFASSTLSPTIPRPTIRFSPSHQKVKDEEATTTETVVETTTPNSLPVVQIPANRDTLVAVPHPVHGRTVLVPLSQLQGGVEQEQQYLVPNEQFLRETTSVQPNYQSQVPVYVRRYPMSQKFRPIAVQVDENGFVREMPQYLTPSPPYTVPTIRFVPPTVPTYVDRQNEVDLIKPPVSTTDFQKLLEQLIIRQSRLEQISMLAQGRRNPYGFQPAFTRRPEDDQGYIPRHHGYLPQNEETQRAVLVRPDQETQAVYQSSYTTTPEPPFTPTRRVARVLHQQEPQDEQDYLPADVREMLLLRMLQLAINPGLPLDIPENFQARRHHQKNAVRNVEILGEEDDTKNTRSKR